jgi:D-serine deaminase-like pyridoxal phosphate-dependent protein
MPDSFLPETVPTPAIVLNAAVVQRNIDRLATYAKSHNIKIRPHTKTHKSLKLGQMQLQAGAGGLTVAKVGEAQLMAEVCDDILLAYPAVDPWRAQKAAELARTITLHVAVDSLEAIDSLAAAAQSAGSTIGILVDLDVGLHRTGVETPLATIPLAQRVAGSKGLRLDGLFIYPGHVWSPAAEQEGLLRAVANLVQETLDLWSKQGLEAKIISGGSTPTAYQSHFVPRQTEIRPGTYIFNDMNTVRGGYCQLEDCGARIVATVISTAVPGQVVLDAGSKTLTSDVCITARDSGHGFILEYPQAKITKLSEEHGQTDVSMCERKPRVGDRVTIIPNHICPCINLQDALWWMGSAGKPLVRMPVDARGKVA